MSCPWVRFRQSRAESNPVCTDVSACTVSHWAPSCKAAGERSTPAGFMWPVCQPRSSRAVPRLRTWAAQAMSAEKRSCQQRASTFASRRRVLIGPPTREWRQRGWHDKHRNYIERRPASS
eukprot:scaffold41651_cov68-Phaeocystis_antarctica.AAC.3